MPTRPDRRRGRVIVAWLPLLVALLFAAPAATTPASAAPVAPAVPAAVLTPCPGQPGYQCGTVAAPIDEAHPDGPTVALAVIRRPAAAGAAALGTIFFNPGGPGESGVSILPVYAGILPAAVVNRFNLVSFDERGTGASSLLDCGPSPAAVAAAPPLPARPGGPLPASVLLAHLAPSCDAAAPALAPHLQTEESARDMDRIRAALGLARISYYGTSYGSVLGAEYARLFPTRVRSMVLDGAVLPTLPLATQAAEQAPAVEAALRHWFSVCRAAACLGGTDPETLYRRVETALARSPLPAPGAGNDLAVTLGDLYLATLFFVTVPAFAPGYPAALQAAAAGNGAPLRSLSLGLETDIDGSSLVGPQWAIACEDSAAHGTAAGLGALARRLAARFPLVGAVTPAYDAGGCAFWPRAVDPITSVALSRGPTVLVIGNTGDPNTPHLAAVQLTRALGRARLLTWDGWGHTWLLNGTHDPCMATAVTRYLTTGVPPPPGTVCS